MRNRSATTRVLWLLGAILQLTLPAAAAWADARLQREAGPEPTRHIEAHRTSQCPRAHPPDCAICRHLSSPVGVAHHQLAPPEFSVEAPVVAAETHAPAALRFALPLSRAPPVC